MNQLIIKFSRLSTKINFTKFIPMYLHILKKSHSVIHSLHNSSNKLSTIAKTKNKIKPTTTVMDGNEACANASYALSECAFIFPITPATPMSEQFDIWSTAGRKSIIGEMPVKVHEMQSELGVAGAMHGAAVSGSLATTFTSSQGLLLMIPSLHKFSGELLPSVFHIAARTLNKQIQSMYGDHGDVMQCRQTGVAMICSNNPQEAQDLAIISHIATIKTRVPFMHFFDGFRTSHVEKKVTLFTDEQIKELYPYKELETNLRNIGMNIDNPNSRGTCGGPEIFFHNVVASHKYYMNAPDIIQSVMNDFATVTGRQYKLFEYYGPSNAERCMILMGSGCETVEQTIDEMNERGENVGLIKVHVFRPWSTRHFLNVLPKSVKRICVMDRSREDGAIAQPLHLDIQMSVSNSDRNKNMEKIIGGQFGISGRDFTPAMVRAIYNELNKPVKDMKRDFIIGINDDVTGTSLDFKEFEYDNKSSLPPNTTQCMFWGMGGDGTVGANKQAIKDIANNTDLHVQSNFFYDAHKGGSVTVSHLRFGPEPIKAEYEIQKADYVSVHNPQWIKQFDVIVKKGKDNSILVINSSWDTVEKMEMNIPSYVRKIIAMKNIKLYNINATNVSQSVGLGHHINSIMQSVFYKLSGVLPEQEAIDMLKNSIRKMYSGKSQNVIDMNISAVDQSINNLFQIKYPIDKWANIKLTDNERIIEHNKILHRTYDANAPEYVQNILYPVDDFNASDIPVSVFEPGGIIPSQTSKYEKRAISTTIPQWNADKCNQCNTCALVCPHSVIRPFLLNKDELKSAPDGYTSKPTKPTINGTHFSIQMSPMDCIGCEVCTLNCPTNALSMVSYEDNVEKQSEFWEYSINNVSNKATMLQPDDRFTVKGSQFYQPLLEFPGACGGCGEANYCKLITQLCGKNAVIANGTGCSVVWGGWQPTNPYGLPWANSLFEDNAEFGYGISQGASQRRQKLFDKLTNNLLEFSVEYGEDVTTAINAWLCTFNDIEKNNIASDNLLQILESKDIVNDILGTNKTMLKKEIQWIIGGDGWAYDIGYGGLDHVLASNENVNILVLDNELYANTGGQASKATPTGASVKFAAGGKTTNKKDLGRMAMMYKNVYVASVAFGADYQQTINAFKEAVSYDGTSIIVALCPCIGWGIDMKYAMQNQQIAVDTGYWPLYRYDPRRLNESKNPLQLDSKRIRRDLKEWTDLQNRFTKLEREQPAIAEKLQEQLKAYNKDRHEELVRAALHDSDYYEYLVEKSDRKTYILYGSETGNAKSVADVILYELKRRNITNVEVMSMNDYEVENLIDCNCETNVIFAISTCGQGDLPKNCEYFMKELTELKDAGKMLSGKVNYAIFGLGDDSYVYFNESAKLLDEILSEMGGRNKLIDTGLGNDKDEDGYDTMFEEWIPNLYSTMNCDNPSMQLMKSIITTDINELNVSQKPEYTPWDCVNIPIIKNIKMCGDEYDRDFRHYEFDIREYKNNKLSFDVGDCLGIAPVNDLKQIETLLDLYNINNENNMMTITKNKQNEIINVIDLFGKKLDVLGKPKRRFYELLSMVATDENEREYLNYLLSAEGNQEFKTFQQNETPTYIDLLIKFPSCQPSINYLIEYIPELKQRLYSIANSPQMYPNQIDLFVLKHEWYTKTDNIYKEGICTKYLNLLSPQNNDKIYGKIHNASVTIPNTHEPPLILTGLGTGLAPLRAHIQDRVYAKSNGENIGPIALIFGSRNKKYEYFYKDEFEEYHSNGKGVLTHLLPAFSRDQDKKYYITDRIEEEGKMITNYLIDKCGYFYYCGMGGNVSNNIEKSIIKSFVKYGNLNENEAKQKIIDMKLSGHYNIEN